MDRGKYGTYVFGMHEQDISISNIIVHPEFSYSNFLGDISILVLSNPASVTEYVKPICLWEEGIAEDTVVNRTGTVVGWGRDENDNSITDLLMEAHMPVVNRLDCVLSHPTYYGKFTSDKTLCAGFRNGKLLSAMSLVFYISLSIIVIDAAYCQLVSPCPRLFKYEPQNNNENDRWYGELTLISDADLSGVWLRIIFDKQSIQLGNWFGEVVTQDNKDYLVKNRNHKLMANSPMKLRFYVKYNPRETPPKLVEFRLNAKTVCPEGGITTQAPTTLGQLLTSSELSTTSNPVNAYNQGNIPQTGNNYAQAGGGFTVGNQHADDDDYFLGDFAFLNKPHKPDAVLEGQCGTVIKRPKPLITHGQATHEGEFPWHAALYHSRNVYLTYICGASLISRWHLLTVAHCVTKQKSQTILPPESLVIYLGKHYLKTWSNPGSIQDRQVEKIIVHPKYSAQSFSNDLAILKLSSPAKISNYVRPICLWEDSVQLETVIGKQGVVIGWGFDQTGMISDELSKAYMPVVSQETCIYSFPEFYSRFTSQSTFCAGFQNGTSVCNGDSGGGIVFPKTGSNPQNPIWQLRGLVSISVALQNQVRCDSKHYVVFTDVAKYLDWIKQDQVHFYK
ncbi:hypothetical protein NQ318_016546 [Aromia moschata]|uniref:Peptidase S1 domain-containing protein n=1 Tax=Aromia moschata TaxID=1265417 RepID=A0AAV8YZA3_9CUCU|nr:hypothetical protein NQ318_016546 [Aromia moschata]